MSAVLAPSQHVRWWELVNEAHSLSKQSGLGLTKTWSWIHGETYPEARESLNLALAEWDSLRSSQDTHGGISPIEANSGRITP